ncbi:glycoside hydrolase 3 protein [Phytophthora pseudosyringae]|uniref:glucan endo-1,3-beta-D-glucosidase n=1 Tax=Phytophthora pseudosyringae TaxID=221518 RepID=A0A8T1VHG5_9STRA|nr:glycoside hydrolase 3 protein [Phytophthora pseudosyringae]
MVNVLRTTSALAMVAAAFGFADAGSFKCTGINYNIRAGPDWATADVKCKPASQISTELATLKGVTDTIRLYSLTDCDQATAVVPAAIEAGLKVELGMWVDSATASFEAEKAAFQTLLATGVVTADNIMGIHVGSEAVYRGDVTPAVAIANLEEIRTLCQANSGAASIPLTIADIGDTYSAHPEMIEAVDYVSANYFPFWEKVAVDGAADFFYTRFSALVETASTYSKEVVVGETGWASDGVGAGASPATAASAAKYFYDFYTLAAEKDLMYFYFSAFDEPWKLATLEANETVEAYFGLFTHEGVLKDVISAEFDNSTASFDGSNSATITVVGGDDSTTSSADAADTATTTTTAASTAADADADDTTVTTSTTQGETTSDDDDTSASTAATTASSHKDCAM